MHKGRRALSCGVSSLPSFYRVRLCRCFCVSTQQENDNQGAETDLIRNTLDRIGAELEVKELSDWYKITKGTVIKRGGESIFKKYSLLEHALKAAYPNFYWEPLKFRGSARGSGYWQQKKNILAALERAEHKLAIEKPEDWYSVTLADLKEVDNFPRDLNRKRLAEYLMMKYPDCSWSLTGLLPSRKVQQRRLAQAVAILFPDAQVIHDARKEAGLINPYTGNYLELDLYLPDLRLAFEYQEKHHFTSADYAYAPLANIQERDTIKQDLARSKNITLITVPCWWDNSLESLAATIRRVRPDLLENAAVGQPIPTEMPKDFLEKNTKSVEDIGEPTNACFFTLSSVDPVNWWMFEKYDGVRGFWNPVKRAFYSRHGNRISFPAEVVNEMPPDLFLDGELWFGPDSFSETMKIVSKAPPSTIDWSKFKYMVFDIPTHKGTYAERYNALVEYLSTKSFKHVSLAPMVLCKDTAHLESFFQDVIDRGGEGVILRDPISPYQPGRSPGYLKHKKYRDTEAKIVGVAELGQWECELPNGVKFTASPGTSEFVKRWNPQAGDIVTFKHRGFITTTGKPKLPTLHRLRKDITWDEVVKNWKEQKNGSSAKPGTNGRKFMQPKSYWKDIENRRSFFLNFAEQMGFNPYKADNWFKVTNQQLYEKQGRAVLSLYDGSLKFALQETFPELFLTQAWPVGKRWGA